MFQFYIHCELSFVQIVSSHCTLFLLHILEMMMNVTMTLQQTTKYSTFHVLLFVTPLFLIFSSTILLPPLVFIYVHSFMFPFPLLFSIVSQSHSLHLCFLNSRTSKVFMTSNNKRKQLSMITPFFSSLTFSPVAFSFLLVIF